MKRENGFTLIEVLLTMAILSIAGVLAFSILGQSVKPKNTVSGRISLSNEANLILAAIEKEYYSEDKLCINEGELLYRNDIEFTKGPFTDPPLDESNCVATNRMVTIEFAVNQTGNTGKSFEIKTTLKRR